MNDQELRFPVEALSPVRGRIFGELFENMATGVPRGVYWTVEIKFAPLKYGPEDYQFDCTARFEWIRWQVRDWHDLAGQDIDSPYIKSYLEACFYADKHDEARAEALSLQRVTGNFFAVQMHIFVDYSSFFGGDAWKDMEVKASRDVPFEGIAVVPENLNIDPEDADSIRRALDPYMDISKFESPVQTDEWAVLFKPKVP